jgi:hypothetical protein
VARREPGAFGVDRFADDFFGVRLRADRVFIFARVTFFAMSPRS